MRPADNALTLRHAVVLGLLQGPAELLPISSSAHTFLIPWLAGWRYAQLDAGARKSFEVALHAAGGLALAMRPPFAGPRARPDRRLAAVLALAIAPPAVAGFALRAQIERRLGGPRSIAAGLAGGALAMALADARPAVAERAYADARPRDGLVLGLAQALALIPGVSRSGATLTAARALGFARADARRLSYETALPVMLGAGALECVRTARSRKRPSGTRGAMAAGAIASALSSSLCATALSRSRRAEGSLLPYAIYRCALAALVMRRTRGRAQ